MKIKEILKTDSLSGSRIILNSNFNNVKIEIENIEKFLSFEDKGLLSSYIKTNQVYAEGIRNLNTSGLKIYNNDLLCIQFNEDGEILIRKDNSCEYNLNQTLETLTHSDIDINALANEVKTTLLNDSAAVNDFCTALVNSEDCLNSLGSSILTNNNFRNQLIDLIHQYS